MNRSDELDKLAAALVAAQADMTNPPLDGVNPHFKSKFTTLATMIDHTRPVLAKHGLVVIQHPVGETGEVGVESILIHSSGQWLSEDYQMPLPKPDPQSTGSVVTYLRRYALASICGVQGDEDNDAEGAMNRTPRAPASDSPRPSAPSRPSQPAKASTPSDSVKAASDKQVKMLFAISHKLDTNDAVKDAVHNVKEKYGVIPMEWASKQIDRLQKQLDGDDGQEADQDKGYSREPDGSEDITPEEIAAAFDATSVDDNNIPF